MATAQEEVWEILRKLALSSEETARFAYRQGLFVLAQSGETVVIRNDEDFKPYSLDD